MTDTPSPLDAPPSRQQPTAGGIEGEEIASSSAGLIFGPTDRHAFQVAEQERPYAAMRDDGYIPTCDRSCNHVLHSTDDPALCISGAFPPAYAVVRSGEELVGHRLELVSWQIAGRRSVVLAKGTDNNGAEPEMLRENTG